MDCPVARLEAVSAAYEGEHTPALHKITLQLAPCERTVVVGPNGAGKTTLLEVVNGLLPATAGRVHVFGKDVAKHGHWLRARIAYMAQELFFAPDTPFLVGDVVSTALFGQVGLLRRPTREHKSRVSHALKEVGMWSMRRRPVGRLSGGQQRKVLLARALAQNAQLLLLDEPTANLDAEAKDDVASIVSRIEAELDATALIVSHEQGPLTEGANRMLRIEVGRLVDNRPIRRPARHPVLQEV